jgi:uncharacterized DUF497 family protein
MGYLGPRLMAVAFTRLASERIRIISFRKANSREQSKYR